MPFSRLFKNSLILGDTPRRALGVVVFIAALVPGWPAQAQDAFQAGLDAYLEGNYQEALGHWKPAAESGNHVAAFNIGVLYARGLGVGEDPVEAVRWYRRSAVGGYANAQFNLGAAYYNGEGTEVNINQAVSWWQRAAEQEHPQALYNLGILYRHGTGVTQDIGRAVDLFERAVAVGETRAKQALTKLRQQAPPDTGEPDEPIEPKTPDRDASLAQREEGLAGENPEHWTVQVFATAKKETAKQFVTKHGLGNEMRIYRAEVDGKSWYKGIYGSYDDKSAARSARDQLEQDLTGTSPWVRRFRDVQTEAAASPEPRDAAALTARQPETDAPRTPAPDEARADAEPAQEARPEETEEAASSEANAATDQSSAGSAPSSTPVAESDESQSLQAGRRAFDAKEYETAFEVWRPLAAKGVAEAQYGIGSLYAKGRGVDRDYSQAFRWYQLAAQQGHMEAQFHLGMLYREGNGVAQNDALGLYWIQSAADQGDERAAAYLENPD